MKLLNNKTPVIRTIGMIGMSCDWCGTNYETHACWAKRTKNHFCSQSCMSKFRTEIIKKNCIICNYEFTVQGTINATRTTTCSNKCMREKRRVFLKYQSLNMDISPIYNFGVHETGEKISKKLTENDILKIRSDKRSQAILAKEFNTSQSNICRIKNKKTWGHVLPKLG